MSTNGYGVSEYPQSSAFMAVSIIYARIRSGTQWPEVLIETESPAMSSLGQHHAIEQLGHVTSSIDRGPAAPLKGPLTSHWPATRLSREVRSARTRNPSNSRPGLTSATSSSVQRRPSPDVV